MKVSLSKTQESYSSFKMTLPKIYSQWPRPSLHPTPTSGQCQKWLLHMLLLPRREPKLSFTGMFLCFQLIVIISYTVITFSYDFFHSSAHDNSGAFDFKSLNLRYVWSKDNLMVSENQIFTNQDNFNGRQLTVTVMPWSHHVLGYEIPSNREDWHEENLYEGHYGYEIEMLEETRKVCSFTSSYPKL